MIKKVAYSCESLKQNNFLIFPDAPPCSDTCDMTVQQLKERDRHHKNMIAHLQKTNQELLREVVHMKEEIILGGLKHYKLDDKHKK